MIINIIITIIYIVIINIVIAMIIIVINAGIIISLVTVSGIFVIITIVTITNTFDIFYSRFSFWKKRSIFFFEGTTMKTMFQTVDQ